MGFLTVLNPRRAAKKSVAGPLPVFRGSSFAAYHGTGAGTITIPAAVQVGDMMVIGGQSQTTVSPTPAGWTAGPTATGGSTFICKGCSFYRIATGGDVGGATTVTVGSTSSNAFCFVAYSGATNVNASGGIGNGNITDTTWGPSAAFSTTVGNTMVVEFWGVLSNSSNALGSGSIPATNRGASVGAFVGSYQSDQTQAAVGAVATQSVTGANGSAWTIVTLALAA